MIARCEVNTHFDLAANYMAKRPSESDTELPRKRVRFGDAGTPLRSEAPPVARRRLQLKQLSPRHVRMKQVKCSPLRQAIRL